MRQQTIGEVANSVTYLWEDMLATVKELLKSDSISESYAQMKKGPVFLTDSVLRCRVQGGSGNLLYIHT